MMWAFSPSLHSESTYFLIFFSSQQKRMCTLLKTDTCTCTWISSKHHKCSEVTKVFSGKHYYTDKLITCYSMNCASSDHESLMKHKYFTFPRLHLLNIFSQVYKSKICPRVPVKVHHSNSTQLAQKLNIFPGTISFTTNTSMYNLVSESNTQIQSQLYGEDEYITQRIISKKQLQVSTFVSRNYYTLLYAYTSITIRKYIYTYHSAMNSLTMGLFNCRRTYWCTILKLAMHHER